MSKNHINLSLCRHVFDHNGQTLTWLSHNTNKPPLHLTDLDKSQALSADKALPLWRAKTATIWHGDYHQAKALLDAAKRRLNKAAKTGDTLLESFHKHRMQQQQKSHLLSHLCVIVQPNWQLTLPRAPNIQAACKQAFGFDNTEPVLISLQALLGYIGAEQWHQKGVAIKALDEQHIHVPFGVFSPLRGEYLELMLQAALPQHCHNAWDIGTGSGVLAALLAKRGLKNIIATDTNPTAIAAAQANFERLHIDQHIQLHEQDLFPAGKADLIVCNPPWLPAKPSSIIETALYDADSHMLKSFLNGVTERLNENGQAWLIMSDLAERIGLRKPNDLSDWIAAAQLRLIAKHDAKPEHAKAQNPNDPLYTARSEEITSLYCLEKI
ncbi:methyltransferase [Vitreoscilla stercoraria]|uniref:Class I SAM-dependent methyltransferase n=1 Tax=Vitreoscilla stercoraria TaxID=61 RepID=A0ABY4EA00_VITST|nr:class I SAM-dependent methyltransferase [Vitreoscilla stercoraria]UOO92121.1 class I SAM-dependent methyltransferase [Vitreoscilla stercoraria]